MVGDPAAAMHEFYIVTPMNVDNVVKAAFDDGSQSARLALLALAEALQVIKRRGHTVDALGCMCIDCKQRFSEEHKPFAFGVILPMFPDKGHTMLAHGICETCFERSDLNDQILRTLREIFPYGNFREVRTMRQ